MLVSLVASSCSFTGPKMVQTYQMGDRVTLGHLVYTVYETQWLTQLGQGPNARIPQNRFFLVRMSISNTATGDTITPSMTLVDDTGQTYHEISNGDGVPQWIGFLRQIKPTESSQGNVLFDVQPKHYKLRVADESEQTVALIDIPLTFTPDHPEAPPIPEAEKK